MEELVDMISAAHYFKIDPLLDLCCAKMIALCKGNWSTLDFAHYINYLNTDFIVRSDGRYDFMHKSLREGILQNTDFAKYNDEICAYLGTLSREDPLKRCEYVWHLLKARKYVDLAAFVRECSQSKDFAEDLKKHGASVDLQVYENYDHNLSSKTSDKMEEIFFKTVDFIVAHI